jgi:hypothetical protein
MATDLLLELRHVAIGLHALYGQLVRLQRLVVLLRNLHKAGGTGATSTIYQEGFGVWVVDKGNNQKHTAM